MKTDSNRIQYIDFVKGIGISLMVLGHSYSNTAGGMIWKSLFSEYLISVIMLWSVTWFLPVMFLSVIFFLANLRFNKYNIFLSAIILLAGIFLPDTKNALIELLLKAGVGYGFISIGYYLHSLFTKRLKWYYVLGAGVVHLFITFSNDTVVMAGRTFGNGLFYLIESCLGTNVIYQVAMRIKNTSVVYRIVSYWGKNSIVILCCHQFIIEMIRILDHKLGMNLYGLGVWEGVVLMIVVMIVLTAAAPTMIFLFGWSFGIQKRKG